MKHWEQLGEATVPCSEQRLQLFRGKDDYFIRIKGGVELMSSRKHGSEDALGALICSSLRDPLTARVLVGGLGMGFTLAAALASVGEEAQVVVAELIPEVVKWNRGPLGECAGRPLDDARTRVVIGDVAELLRDPDERFDAIALDVDNGPEGLTHDANDWIYSPAGIAATRRSLRPGGCVGYWSAGPNPKFRRLLQRSGFEVRETRVHAHGNKGQRHTLWLAR